MKLIKSLLLAAAFTGAFLAGASAQVNITTWQVNTQHTGVNNQETILTPNNVNSADFGLLYTCATDGQTYGQCLYASAVNVSGTNHNIVYVGTEHCSLYAFDADTGVQIWHDSMIPAGTVPVPQSVVGSGDISVELGLTTTPVIDLSSSTIYVVSKVQTTANTTYQQYLHALDLATGAEKFGGPVLINPTFPGKATDGSGGVVPFSALHEHTRAAMTEYNGIVYISYASHSDTTPYHGEILGYNASTLQLVRAFNSTPNGSQAGVWGGGSGPAIDSNGNMFVTTGNGTWDQASGSPYTTFTDWGESFLKLPTTGTGPFSANFSDTTTYFTPAIWNTLNGGDLDIGSSGVCLLPDQTAGPHTHIMVGGGKGAVLYVLDRDTMGGEVTGDPAAIQELAEPNGAWLFVTPAYFNGYIYYAPGGNGIEQRAVGYNSVTGGYIADPPTFTSADTYPVKGSSCFITANGTNNGLVWAVNGSLRVHNAANVSGQPLYQFNVPGSTTKFNIPTVANGKAYVTGFNTTTNAGDLYILGETIATVAPTAPTNLTAATTTSSSITLNWTSTSTNQSGFIVERGTASTGPFTQVTTTASNVTTYVDTGLTAGNTYYYEVVATNSVGNSGPTNVASAKTFNPYNPAGLLVYLPMAEGPDDPTETTADVTGNGNTGSLNGEYNWIGGIFEWAIQLHGTGHAESSITVTNTAAMQFTATQSFTISAWVNPQNIHGVEQAIIAKSSDQGNEYGIYINSNNQWVFRGPQGDIVGSTAVQDMWTHVAGVQDGVLGTRSLYVNGVLVATGAAQVGNGAGDLWLGQQNLLLTQPDSFPGYITEFRLYNIPIPPSQIISLMSPPIINAVSNETQGGTVYGKTLLPSTTTVVEPREGSPVGTYSVVLTFSAPVSNIAASLQLQNGGTGVGTVGTITYDVTNTIATVPLTGVANQQMLDLHLTGISPGNGTADIPFDVLWGDVNGDGVVNSLDATLITNNLGAALSATTGTAFYDINCDGVINSTDSSLITSFTGNYVGLQPASNLALGGTASGSTFQAGNGYANANDGSLTTRWAAGGATYPSYWQVDLGSVDTITSVATNWFDNTTRAYSYNIQVSATDSTFSTPALDTTVVNNPNNTFLAPSSTYFETDSFAPIAARYVRINVTNSTDTGGFPSAYEFQINGVPGSGATPVISTQPQPQVVMAGQPVTFSVGVSGVTPDFQTDAVSPGQSGSSTSQATSGSVTYQWQKNGNNIYGATSSSYTIPSASGAYAGTYSVVITNSYGSVTSNSFTLAVNSPSIPSDTPTMPQWALILMGLLFLVVAQRVLSPKLARQGVHLLG